MKLDLYKLNEEQQHAISVDAKIVLVRSAVGSGKTSVLVHKILQLFHAGVHPQEMMVLSFTRKAADEIQKRLIAAEPKLTEIEYCGTFHSIANKLLRNYFDITLLGLTPDFSILEEYEQQQIIEDICFDHNVRLGKNVLQKLHLPEMQNNKNIMFLNREYQAYKRRCNLVDFNDLISFLAELLDTQKLCFSYIAIDEFQDTDDIQAGILKKFVEYGSKLFAVGDPNQTIYSWRGSNPEIFDVFKKLEATKEAELSLNYRSTASIIGGVKGLFPSPLRSQREPGEKIQVREFLNTFQESLYIANKIKELNDSGIIYDTIAILYRRQNERKTISKVFTENQIPFVVQRQPQLEEIPVLYWLLQLLCICYNPKNVMVMRRILSNKKYGVKGEDRKILKEKISLFGNFVQTRRTKEELQHFFSLDKIISPTSLSFDKDREYINAFWTEIIPDEHVIDFASVLRKNILCREYNLTKIIEKVEAVNDSGVQLMTLHNSKGLEFSHVFIIGANEGNIPLRNSNTQEEKRLLFVGITRSKNYVSISYTKDPEIPNDDPKPSHFLNEITPKCILWQKMNPEKTNVQELVNTIKQKQSSTSTKKAHHPKYGEGEIIGEDEQNITVNFPGYETKTFNKQFCPLTFPGDTNPLS